MEALLKKKKKKKEKLKHNQKERFSGEIPPLSESSSS